MPSTVFKNSSGADSASNGKTSFRVAQLAQFPSLRISLTVILATDSGFPTEHWDNAFGCAPNKARVSANPILMVSEYFARLS